MASLKKALVLTLALPMIFASASSFAGNKHHGEMSCKMKGDKKILRQLNLTEAQKEQMKTLRKANRAEMKAERAENRNQMETYHQQMQQLVLSDHFDEAQARTLAEQMSQQQVERRVEMMENRQKVLNVLTPEQKAQYKTLKSEHQKMCEEQRSSHHE